MQYPSDDIDPNMFEDFPPTMTVLETIGYLTCCFLIIYVWIQLGAYFDKRYERKMKMKLNKRIVKEEERKEEIKKRAIRRKKFLKIDE